MRGTRIVICTIAAVVMATMLSLSGWVDPPASAQAPSTEIQSRGCRLYVRADKKIVSTCPFVSVGAVTFPTQTAHYALMGPTTGSPAVPTFRALVATDLPGTLGNTTIPVLTVSTSMIFASGMTLAPLSGTASLDYAQANANTCEVLTIAVTGAADGNPVSVGVPHALANHNLTATVFSWISAADTVSVRRCVISADGSNPAAATVRATVWKP